MANSEQLQLLKKGVEEWNQFRREQSDLRPDLSEIDLRGVNLSFADLRWADLRGSNLNEANLSSANLSGANLNGTSLYYTHLNRANLSGANMHGAMLYCAHLKQAQLNKADLSESNLSRALILDADLRQARLRKAQMMVTDLSGADLSGADLTGATFVRTKLCQTILNNCQVTVVLFKECDVTQAQQTNLIIQVGKGKTRITVDHLEMAYLIRLLFYKQEIPEEGDTPGHKGVLILGYFYRDRKRVLDALREKLHALGFEPIVCNFKQLRMLDFVETVPMLARAARFIIADITNPHLSYPNLQIAIPNYMLPFIPILQEGEQPFPMFEKLQGQYEWALDTLIYDTPERLMAVMEKAIVQPALEKYAALMEKKSQSHVRHISDYL